jgi:hypothetical protein
MNKFYVEFQQISNSESKAQNPLSLVTVHYEILNFNHLEMQSNLRVILHLSRLQCQIQHGLGFEDRL